MKNYFKLSEFHKPWFYVPMEVREKIYNHISILNPVREQLGCSIEVSKKSGYRPKEYEILKERSGNSQHCYFGKGAVDLTCRADKFQELFELLQESGVES